MTKKQEMILGLNLVKNEHTKWVNYAEAKFKGLEIKEDLIPKNHTECACGKMISENGQIIYHLKSAHTLAKDHEDFHKISEDLFNFINNKEKGNIFTKGNIKKRNKETMHSYADVLRNLSDNLLKTFDNIANEINCIDDKKIEEIFSNPDN